MTEIEALEEKLLHEAIHHNDSIEELRHSFKRKLDEIDECLRIAKVAISRTPPKFNVVEYEILESIDAVAKARQI